MYADVGLAMGSGCAAAKMSSDLILTDNDFESSIRAIMWGRNIYHNVSRFLQFQITVNIACLLILILGILDHYRAMKALRERKHRLVDLGIVHSDMPSRIASSMAVALALLLLGVMAIANIVFGLG